MKKICWLWLVCFPLLTSGQNYVFHWAKMIPLKNLRFCADKEDNVYIAGDFDKTTLFEGIEITTENKNQDIIVAKYTNNGDLIWLRQLGGPDYDGIEEIRVDSNGDLMLATNFHYLTVYQGDTITSGGHGIVISKIAQNGDFLWYFVPVYNTNQCVHSQYFVLDKNDNFVLAGDASYGQVVFPDTAVAGNCEFIAHFNPDKTLGWVSTRNWGFDQLHQCITDYSGNLLVFYDTIYKYASDGDLLWKKRINFKLYDVKYYGEHSASDSLNNVFISATGSGIIVGTDTLFSGLGRKIFLIKITPDGIPVFAKTCKAGTYFTPTTLSMSHELIGIAGYFRDTLIFDQDTLPAPGFQNKNTGFITLMDHAGQIKCSKMIWSLNSVFPLHISAGKSVYVSCLSQDTTHFDNIVLSSGGSPPYYSYFLARIAPENTTPEISDDDIVELFPNPTRSFITIRIPVAGQRAAVAIFNLKGQLIQEHTIMSSVQTIEMNNLSRGTYLIRIIMNERVVIKKVVKI
jgi:hypothetical protein